jgi:hypothetical protein
VRSALGADTVRLTHVPSDVPLALYKTTIAHAAPGRAAEFLRVVDRVPVPGIGFGFISRSFRSCQRSAQGHGKRELLLEEIGMVWVWVV